jgi:hypothetical protein
MGTAEFDDGTAGLMVLALASQRLFPVPIADEQQCC